MTADDQPNHGEMRLGADLIRAFVTAPFGAVGHRRVKLIRKYAFSYQFRQSN